MNESRPVRHFTPNQPFHFIIRPSIVIPLFFSLIVSCMFDRQEPIARGCVAYFCYITLILTHEAGHAVFARALGCKVFAIELYGRGGFCFYQQSPSELRNIIIHWGGIVAQALLFCLAVAVAAQAPRSIYSTPILIVWCAINVYIALINLLPLGRRDGSKVWRLFPLLWRKATRAIGIWRNLPLHLNGSPPLHDECDLLRYVLSSADVSPLLAKADIDAALILNAIDATASDKRGSVRDLYEILEKQAVTINPSDKRRLFSAWLRRGSLLRSELEAAGVNLRTLQFAIAHGKAERQPIMNTAAGYRWALRLVNDDFTPMEFVVAQLKQHFSMSAEDAAKLMMQVHIEGATIIETGKTYADSIAMVAAINDAARAKYLPLYCQICAKISG